MTSPIAPVWDEKGLAPVIVQDAASGDVLMLAWANAQAYAMTLETGQATYFSRSRQELWVKGATSGHTQAVRQVSVDCDADALLYVVDQTGPACHTGAKSCFDAGGMVSQWAGGEAPWLDAKIDKETTP